MSKEKIHLSEDLIRDFADAHKRGEEPDVDAFCDRGGPECTEEIFCGLVVEDVVRRAERGLPVSLSRYLTERGYLHRRSICEELNDALFSDEAELAQKLGLWTIGHYRTQRILGFGGFGVVFEASRIDESVSSEPVALKVAHPGIGRAEDLLENEARVLRNLNQALMHPVPGLPRLRDAGPSTASSWFLATDIVHGLTLLDWLATGPELMVRRRVCQRLALLVRHLHECRVYHGDISPDNIIINSVGTDPSPCLIDFAASGKVFRTHDLPVVVNARYAAPELLDASSEPTDRSDMWSLAIIIFEVLYGEHPFGHAPAGCTVADWRGRVRSVTRPTVPPGTSDELRNVLLTCFAADPSLRHAVTAEHVRQAIPSDADSFLKAEDTSVAGSDRSADVQAARLSYLRRIATLMGTVPIPAAMPSRRDPVVPIEDIVIDLPLLLEEDAEARYAADRGDYAKGSYAAQVSSERERHATVGPFMLGNRLAAHKAMVLVGTPGSGKSTLFAWAAHCYASSESARLTGNSDKSCRECAPQIPTEQLTPVVLVCRDLGLIDERCTHRELISRQLVHWGFGDDELELLVRLLTADISNGRAFILVDGLDEIGSQEARRHVCGVLNSLVAATGTKVFATSRPIGFGSIKQALDQFAVLSVDHLGSTHKAAYVKRWAELNPDGDSATIHRHVCDNTRIDRLTGNMLMFALLVQMCAREKFLPNRRVDVFGEVTRIMLEQQRKGNRPELTFNECWPHLEHLAYRMREQQVQRLLDTEVVKHFKELRESEADDPEVLRRAPGELLQDVLDRVQLLNVAGMEIDKTRGREQRSIQFFHQSLQEYFAGRAINHSRGGESGEPAARICTLLSDDGAEEPSLTDRLIKDLGYGGHVEPVIAEYWHEAIAMAVAQMDPEAADLAIKTVLGSSEASDRERRARAALAMHCLVDDPRVTEEGAMAIFDAAATSFLQEDASFLHPKTLMDAELAAVSAGRWSTLLHDTLLRKYCAGPEGRRVSVGCAYMASIHADLPIFSEATASEILTTKIQSLSVLDGLDRVPALLQLTQVLFSACGRAGNGDISFISDHDRQSIVSVLLEDACDPDSAVCLAAAWALLWLLRARDRKPIGCKRLTTVESEPLLDIVVDRNRPVDVRRCAMWCISVSDAETPTMEQSEWIYNFAVIADGGSELWSPFNVVRSTRIKIIESVSHVLENENSVQLRQSSAVVLGRLGLFPPSAVEPLIVFTEDDLLTEEERDEAWVYLAFNEDPRAGEYLARSLRVEPEHNEFTATRGLLCAIGRGDPQLLAEALSDGTEVTADAIAKALATMKDPRGDRYLTDCEDHPNPLVRQAVVRARECAKALQEKRFTRGEKE